MFYGTRTYELDKIKSKKLVVHTHQGLGDHIICNGLINYFSEIFDEIYLPVKSRDFDNISYLYKENNKVKIFNIGKFDESDIKKNEKNEIKSINFFAKDNNLKILNVGFKKTKSPFNKSFYSQFSLDYLISINKFKLPNNPEDEITLFNHLKDVYGINNSFALVHKSSSRGDANVEINTAYPIIFVEKETDIFKNIFLYRYVINQAKEIHCIDSSFLHLTERVNTNADLYFHNLKNSNNSGTKVFLTKQWKTINYN